MIARRTRSCSTWSSWSCASCCRSTSSRATTRRSSAARRSRRSRATRASWATPSMLKLLDACDSFIPEPKREIDKPFLMPVEDVFTISGRGTVVTGRVERGIVKVGEEIEIVGFSDTRRRSSRASRCSASCSTRAARATTSARCCAAPRARKSSAARCWRSRARSRRTRSSRREVYVLKKEEGGRHTPFFNNYRPQFYFRTTDVTGS